MSDPYLTGVIPSNIYSLRKNISGVMVAVMDLHLENRNLNLILQPTRVLKKYDIVELIGTLEYSVLGEKVDSITYLGFLEVMEGGVIKRDDEVLMGNLFLGKILGYDETHMPNHLNVIIKMEFKKTGADLGFEINHRVIFLSK